ncbi:YgiQ family radical SAM protein [Methanomassiliicoccales archaeon LGM-RCC1]|nr:YgiQ family radical SAM protein [Methanomassiliicoccales archaeon LGM-RCC1]
MFIPTTREEVAKRGWDALDVVIVSGDTYTDNSYNGAALIGHWLIYNGFRVGIIAQPRIDAPDDITRLGLPELYWSVSAGCVDSMVANYTAVNKFRKDDDFTPGGVNNRRPDRACIAYTNLIKKYAKGKPIILGGIEASLRRVAHYDYWSDSVRRSVLFDSKADAITYGMTELSNLAIANAMKDGADWKGINGVCYASNTAPEGYLEMPSYEECSKDHKAFNQAFSLFRDNCDPITAKGLVQKHGDRYLVQNPPSRLLTTEELDTIYGLDFEDEVHPYYLKDGPVKAMDTIKNSITTHRGCYGDCSFCAIAVHQGRTVVSRSEESILNEAKGFASKPDFNGVIRDVGGPTANMYGIECRQKLRIGACKDKSCLGDKPCPKLCIDHGKQVQLLRDIRSIPGVKRVFVGSGIRYDMILADEKNGERYLENLVRHHVSGQMKIAPEHVSRRVLKTMGKPGPEKLTEFKDRFDKCTARCGKELFLTYYFIAAHPGCRNEDMEELSRFCHSRLKTNPEQVQIFTPTPSTASTSMYHTGEDLEGHRVFSEHSIKGKQAQKRILVRDKDA